MMGPIALAPRWRSALAAFALLAVAAGDDQPCVTDRDVILVVDRSVSITKEGWNDVVLDTLYSFIDSFAPSVESNVRLGIVVFPAFDGKETRDDLSGGAAVAANLTYDADSLKRLVNATVRVDDEAQVGTACANGKLNDGSCECDPQGAANSTLSWPCGGWHWTPTWQALWLARRMFLDLDDVDATGLVDHDVYVVTDGAPAHIRNDDYEYSRAEKQRQRMRPTHLTLSAATDLKDTMSDLGGGDLFGVGVGPKWSDFGTYCAPFCDEGGGGLFAGNYDDDGAYSGTVTLYDFDNSDLYCGATYEEYPYGCAGGDLASKALGCDKDCAVAYDAMISGHTAAIKEARFTEIADIDALSLQAFRDDFRRALCTNTDDDFHLGDIAVTPFPTADPYDPTLAPTPSPVGPPDAALFNPSAAPTAAPQFSPRPTSPPAAPQFSPRPTSPPRETAAPTEADLVTTIGLSLSSVLHAACDGDGITMADGTVLDAAWIEEHGFEMNDADHDTRCGADSRRRLGGRRLEEIATSDLDASETSVDTSSCENFTNATNATVMYFSQPTARGDLTSFGYDYLDDGALRDYDMSALQDMVLAELVTMISGELSSVLKSNLAHLNISYADLGDFGSASRRANARRAEETDDLAEGGNAHFSQFGCVTGTIGPVSPSAAPSGPTAAPTREFAPSRSPRPAPSASPTWTPSTSTTRPAAPSAMPTVYAGDPTRARSSRPTAAAVAGPRDPRAPAPRPGAAAPTTAAPSAAPTTAPVEFAVVIDFLLPDGSVVSCGEAGLELYDGTEINGRFFAASLGVSTEAVETVANCGDGRRLLAANATAAPTPHSCSDVSADITMFDHEIDALSASLGRRLATKYAYIDDAEAAIAAAIARYYGLNQTAEATDACGGVSVDVAVVYYPTPSPTREPDDDDEMIATASLGSLGSTSWLAVVALTFVFWSVIPLGALRPATPLDLLANEFGGIEVEEDHGAAGGPSSPDSGLPPARPERPAKGGRCVPSGVRFAPLTPRCVAVLALGILDGNFDAGFCVETRRGALSFSVAAAAVHVLRMAAAPYVLCRGYGDPRLKGPRMPGESRWRLAVLGFVCWTHKLDVARLLRSAARRAHPDLDYTASVPSLDATTVLCQAIIKVCYVAKTGRLPGIVVCGLMCDVVVFAEYLSRLYVAADPVDEPKKTWADLYRDEAEDGDVEEDDVTSPLHKAASRKRWFDAPKESQDVDLELRRLGGAARSAPPHGAQQPAHRARATSPSHRAAPRKRWFEAPKESQRLAKEAGRHAVPDAPEFEAPEADAALDLFRSATGLEPAGFFCCQNQHEWATDDGRRPLEWADLNPTDDDQRPLDSMIAEFLGTSRAL
ncbi:hypothetical protein SO694_0023301 [Aureococcus anophagefferens]|uniref:VWFA domain-containing protein n=1 Tax=Aureococcus anophagefferens TaxID=44056 RepID=A0ABR1FSU9_AURAN